jgi:hypothetical protein
MWKTAVLSLTILTFVGCKRSTPAAANIVSDVGPAAVPSDPPTVNVGLDVEQAYAAIPHRRTVWQQSSTTVPTEDAIYLQNIFEVIDQAIAVRVAGLQSFSNGNFNSVDVDSSFDQLITYARAMHVPADLAQYHQQILTALTSERQFFAQWRSRAQADIAQQLPNDPSVRSASAASRAAYNELMRLYPNENPNNKDAFFDYHCALDFL